MPGAPHLASPAERLLAPRLEQRIVPGLDRIRRVLTILGNPERKFASVLVVGTNGKGSTAALLASILHAHALPVGLYTSPHLVRIEERIRIGGEEIEPAQLAEVVRELAPFPELSYFESLTAAAFLEFARRKVRIAVLEAGLGGRWDATNTAGQQVSLLTNVGTDHQAWLGPTRAHVAAEKAAALSGREAIVGSWDDEVAGVIRSHAAPQTPLSLASDWADVEVSVRGGMAEGASQEPRIAAVPACPAPDPGPLPPIGTPVTYSVAGIRGAARLHLLGDHQLANLRLALAGAAALAKHRLIPPLDGGTLGRGITSAGWPGRLQWHAWRGRRLILDGAHNLEATDALATALVSLGLAGKVDLLFSCLDDKPLDAMAARLRPLVRAVKVAPIDSPRATPIDRLAAAFADAAAFPDVGAALRALPSGRPVLVTGSLRLVGEVLALTGRDDG